MSRNQSPWAEKKGKKKKERKRKKEKERNTLWANRGPKRGGMQLGMPFRKTTKIRFKAAQLVPLPGYGMKMTTKSVPICPEIRVLGREKKKKKRKKENGPLPHRGYGGQEGGVCVISEKGFYTEIAAGDMLNTCAKE